MMKHTIGIQKSADSTIKTKNYIYIFLIQKKGNNFNALIQNYTQQNFRYPNNETTL